MLGSIGAVRVVRARRVHRAQRVRINLVGQFSNVDVDYDLYGVDEFPISTIRGKVHQISAASSNCALYQ